METFQGYDLSVPIGETGSTRFDRYQPIIVEGTPLAEPEPPGRLEISVVTGANEPLGGACFQLLAGEQVVHEVCDNGPGDALGQTDGSILLDGVAPGAYTLHQSGAVSGFFRGVDRPITIAAGQTTRDTVHNPLAIAQSVAPVAGVVAGGGIGAAEPHPIATAAWQVERRVPGILIYYDESVIAGHSLATGTRLWQIPLDPLRPDFGPTRAAGERFLWSAGRTLMSLDGVTGTPVWTTELPGRVTELLYDDGAIAVLCAADEASSRDGVGAVAAIALLGLDSDSGQERWRIDLGPLPTESGLAAEFARLTDEAGLTTLQQRLRDAARDTAHRRKQELGSGTVIEAGQAPVVETIADDGDPRTPILRAAQFHYRPSDAKPEPMPTWPDGDARTAAGRGELALADLLPTEADIPNGLLEAENTTRSLAELAQVFTNPDDAATRLDGWGWRENVWRAFAHPAGAGPPHRTTYLYSSIHRFSTADGVATAMRYFANDAATALDLHGVDVEPIGDEAIALRGALQGVNRVVVYVRQGPIMLASGGDSVAGDPYADMVAIGQTVADRARAALAAALPATTNTHAAHEPDFHQVLGALGEHPALLRRLGLVVDLTVPVSALRSVGAGSDDLTTGRIRVVPTGWQPITHGRLSSPWTALDIQTLRPLSRPDAGAPRTRELLDPAAAAIEVVQIDVDGAALKAIDTSATLAKQRANADRPIDAEREAGVPSLRSAGFAIVRPNTASDLNETFNLAHNHQARMETGTPEADTFYAEDLTRGYRLDVREERTRTWRSLHERVVSYRSPDGGPATPSVTDEGFLQLGLTEPAAPAAPNGPANELYVHETLVHWDGWSLSAPRPGLSLSADPRAPDPALPETQPARVPNTARTSLPLEITAVARPGSLPRLRFGSRYRFRLRPVDLAGNSLTLAEADRLVASPDGDRFAFPPAPQPYQRFDPVPAPVVVLRQPTGAGEAIDRLVLRSEYDRTAEAYAAANPERGFTAITERHIAPPKAAQITAESHGRFDAAIGAANRSEIARQYEIAKREQGALTPSVGADGAPGDPIHPEAQLRLPYLPDPLAIGAAITNLPGVTAGTILRLTSQAISSSPTPSQSTPAQAPVVIAAPPDAGIEAASGAVALADAGAAISSLSLVDYGDGAWPDRLPFRLRLAETAEPGAAPFWDAAERVLSVFLPKAASQEVWLSSATAHDQIDLLGLWQWMVEDKQARLSPSELERWQRVFGILAADGLFWLLTPFRRLRLVHAVQRPLEESKILVLEPVTRLPNETHADLVGIVRVNGASTANLELRAAWSEPVDRLEDATPGTDHGSAVIVEVPIGGDRGPLAHYRPEEDSVRFLPGPSDGQSRRARHELRDTKHRRVHYRTVATTRFREFFPEEIANDPDQITRISSEVELSIPSSARPAGPLVRYVVPAFGWDQTTRNDPQVLVRRRQGGVRVLLNRPWFSSGEGELLGVVCWPVGSSPSAESLPYITRWGRDPIWRAPAASVPSAVPTVEAFTRATAYATELRLADDERVTVDVAGHEVWFDPARGLWTCDLAIDRPGGGARRRLFPLPSSRPRPVPARLDRRPGALPGRHRRFRPARRRPHGDRHRRSRQRRHHRCRGDGAGFGRAARPDPLDQPGRGPGPDRGDTREAHSLHRRRPGLDAGQPGGDQPGRAGGRGPGRPALERTDHPPLAPRRRSAPPGHPRVRILRGRLRDRRRPAGGEAPRLRRHDPAHRRDNRARLARGLDPR